ncbi:MAG TPA: hypothetical protein DC047_12480 [Blastocatellia bacterium]|nr:hypothetical protein [Blastocatellia bacterium]
MNTDRQDYLLRLEDELLMGDVMLSEWSTFLARDADTAFQAGADLAAILMSQAAIECHLRYEYFDGERRKLSFYELIEQSPVPLGLKIVLHKVRKYRNRWVHVNDPHDDEDLLTRPEYYETELEEMAFFAIKAMMQIIYLEQGL